MKEGDSVTHPDLGPGEVVEVKKSALSIPMYAMILWDRDPPANFAGGANPCLIEMRTLTLIQDE